MRKYCNHLVSIYCDDLENSLDCKLEQFIPFIKTSFNNVALFPLDFLKWMVRKLNEVFPNVYVAFMVCICIYVYACMNVYTYSYS